MQKTKTPSSLFPECVRRVEKQSTKAGRLWFFGYMLRKYQGENLRSDSTLHIRSLPHDLVTCGIPHAAPSSVRLFATPWTLAYQPPLSMGFSRQ